MKMKRIHVLLIGVLLVALANFCDADPIEWQAQLSACPWALATGDIDGDGTVEAVFGSIDNGLYVFDDGVSRQVADIQGFAFDVEDS